MDQITDLRELLKHELKDLYSAETQIIEGLPKMIETARNPQLKKALSDHLKVTKDQKARLDKIEEVLNITNEKEDEKAGFFANLFKSKEGEQHCKAMEGLIKEANSLMSEDMSIEVMDAALIAAAQKIEHYEIGSYGTARAYAEQMGMTEVEKLLRLTLDEEYFADDSLTKLAIEKVNIKAEGNVKAELSGNKSNSNGRAISEKSTSGNSGTRNSAESANKKTSPSKTGAKKSAAKKSTPGSGAKKAVPKKSAAKKSTAGSGAKKAAPKRSAAKKSTAGSGAKKAAPKRSAAKKSTAGSGAKKAAPKRSTAKKSTAGSGAKKAAPKRPAAKKFTAGSGAKKAAAKKTTSRSGAKKSAAKKSVPTRSGGKKSAVKKGAKRSGGRR
ncbi:MAG: DUF892 family protein [Ferruginibacter sp.]